MYMMRGFSCAVIAMKGNDFPSFSMELYLGWLDLISSLSRTSASEGLCVTMKSTLSDSLTSLGTISLSGFLEKYDLTLDLRSVAFPTYRTLSSDRLNRYTPGSLGSSKLLWSMPMDK